MRFTKANAAEFGRRGGLATKARYGATLRPGRWGRRVPYYRAVGMARQQAPDYAAMGRRGQAALKAKGYPNAAHLRGTGRFNGVFRDAE